MESQGNDIYDDGSAHLNLDAAITLGEKIIYIINADKKNKYLK